jgi:hypothetical protein
MPDLNPLLTNLRAQREWIWLSQRFSVDQLSQAIQSLGAQRPYPLNIARKLGVLLPAENDLPMTEAQQQSSRIAARASIDAARALLAKQLKNS